MRSTVVVVTHNNRHQLEPCLKALLPTLGTDDEVIVVDNMSSDGTPELIAERYPSVRLVRSESNRGFGSACNLAARLSLAEYLVFLNPDTQPCADWLDALVAGLADFPTAGLATAKLLLAADPNRIDAVGHDVHISGIATCRGWGESAHRYEVVEEVDAVSGACFAIRREVFDELGGFDERLFLYYEDDDLSLRARLAGHECIAVPGSRVLHDHVSGVSAEKLRYLERNRVWTLLKLLRWRTLLALLPVLLGAEVVAWGFALLQGPTHVLAKVRATLELVSWLHLLPATRATVARRLTDRTLLEPHTTHLTIRQVSDGALATAVERTLKSGFAGGRMLADRLNS